MFRFELNHETNFGCGFLSTKRRARTRHKKRGRSWNLRISFSRPEQQWKLSVGYWEEKLSLTFRCQSKMETSNKPFPSCPKPLFESEAKCEVIDMRTFFHKKGFALRLVFEVRVFGTHKWLINSVNGMHFGGHQSMCLFVSELNTQINKNNNGFEHFRKWPLNLRSWKTGKVHGKSHGTWKAQTNINPCEINTKKGDSVPKKIPWCYSKQQRPMSDSFARKRPINECIYTWIWLLLKEKQFFRLTPCILNRTASKPKVYSWCKQHFFRKR